MATFDLNSDNHFLTWSIAGQILVWEVQNPNEIIAESKTIKILDTTKEGLKVHGVLISGSKLKDLEAELIKYRLMVNRYGYCYMRVVYGNETSKYHRANDLFGWSKYGVKVSPNVMWNRCEMFSNKVTIDFEEKEKEVKDCKAQLEEKEKKISLCQNLLEEKDKELKEKTKVLQGKLGDDDDVQELKNCKLELNKKERELSILTILWEKRLESLNTRKSDEFKDKEKEIYFYARCVEKEQQLKKMSTQLIVEQKKVNDLKFGMISLAKLLNDLNKCIEREEEEGGGYLLPGLDVGGADDTTGSSDHVEKLKSDVIC